MVETRDREELDAIAVYIVSVDPLEFLLKPLQTTSTGKMKTITYPLIVASVALAAPTSSNDDVLDKRLENGLGRTPALGYNNWVRSTLPTLPQLPISQVYHN